MPVAIIVISRGDTPNRRRLHRAAAIFAFNRPSHGKKSEEKQSNTRDFDENDREILRESVARDLFCAIYEFSDSAGRY